MHHQEHHHWHQASLFKYIRVHACLSSSATQPTHPSLTMGPKATLTLISTHLRRTLCTPADWAFLCCLLQPFNYTTPEARRAE